MSYGSIEDPATLRRLLDATPLIEADLELLLEHMRIAQWDMLEFSRDPKHVSPEFPKGYWPTSAAPPSEKAWDESVRRLLADRAEFEKLVLDPARDLTAPLAHGDGQTLLREVLLTADHTSH